MKGENVQIYMYKFFFKKNERVGELLIDIFDIILSFLYVISASVK